MIKWLISDGGSAACGDVDATSGAGARGDIGVSGAIGNVTYGYGMSLHC